MEDLCKQIHKSLVAEYSYSLVWGTSSKHYPQRWGLQPPLDERPESTGCLHEVIDVTTDMVVPVTFCHLVFCLHEGRMQLIYLPWTL